MATTSYVVGDSPYYVDAAADGIEFNTILGGRVFLAGGTVKRKNQKNLEGFGSIQYKLGGADFEGREAPVNFDEESIFDILTVTLGAYGFAGNNNIGTGQLNTYYRVGFESDIRYLRYRLKLASVFGEDDNSIYDGSVRGPLINQRSRVISAEGLYLIGSSIIPSFRFEYEDNGSIIRRRYIPAIAYAPLQNGKLVLEYKHEISTTDRGLLNLGFTASF
jgi:hypothetical protein